MLKHLELEHSKQPLGILQYEKRSQFISTAILPLWHKHLVALFSIHISTMSSIYYQQGEWMEQSRNVQLRPSFDVHTSMAL